MPASIASSTAFVTLERSAPWQLLISPSQSTTPPLRSLIFLLPLAFSTFSIAGSTVSLIRLRQDIVVVLYTSLAGFVGIDVFNYSLQDPISGEIQFAKVTVEISSDRAPLPADDVMQVYKYQTGIKDVLVNDIDPDSELDASSLQIVSQGLYGECIALNPSGTIQYIPGSFVIINNSDQCSYRICDEEHLCANATLSIFIVDNAPPICFDDVAYCQFVNQVISIPVLQNDNDADNNLLTHMLLIPTSPSHGIVFFDPQSSTLRYTCLAKDRQVDTFSYIAFDASGASCTASVHVAFSADGASSSPTSSSPSPSSSSLSIVFHGPVAVDDFVEGYPNVRITINVLLNDYDIDGDLNRSSLSFSSSNKRPSAGIAYIGNDFSVHYLANLGFIGFDNFSYTICDSQRSCSTANVMVKVVSTPLLSAVDDQYYFPALSDNTFSCFCSQQ
jgi:hypothetical protein